jgi:hypothetical protein
VIGQVARNFLSIAAGRSKEANALDLAINALAKSPSIW